MRERAALFAVLLVMGAGWGVTQPLAKIAVSEGYRHFGLIFWQLTIGAFVLTVVQALRGKPFRCDRQALTFYAVIALIGTVIPNSASYEAARHLPAGILSILLSLVPIIAFPLAIALGNEGFSWRRLAGLSLGAAGIVLIAAPKASLPQAAMLAFLPLALVAPAFYALESNVVAKWGTGGLSPVALLHGASVVGAPVALIMAIATGQGIDPRPPWGAPDMALALSSAIHVTVYSAYVWLVGRAGAVFAAQVSYPVTAFGVIWSMVLLGESYAATVWLAMAVILTGVFMVQPRRQPQMQLADIPQSHQV